MKTLSAKQVLSNLYGLMMEMNYYLPDEQLIIELQEKHDSHLENHLIKIRQISARLKAQQNKANFQKAIEQIKALKEKGLDELKKIINPQEQAQLLPLFRKFEELTEEDKESIFEEQELLYLIEVLKNKMDESSE